MPNKRYEAGVRWEREVIKIYEADGAVCTRAAGSHSPFDVVAVYPGNLTVLIQCKVTKSESHANKLCVDFTAEPPLKQGYYLQVLEVKIPRKKRLGAIIDSLPLKPSL